MLPLSLSLRQPPNHASELLILTSPLYNLAFYFALMKQSKNSDVKLHKAMWEKAMEIWFSTLSLFFQISRKLYYTFISSGTKRNKNDAGIETKHNLLFAIMNYYGIKILPTNLTPFGLAHPWLQQMPQPQGKWVFLHWECLLAIAPGRIKLRILMCCLISFAYFGYQHLNKGRHTSNGSNTQSHFSWLD